MLSKIINSVIVFAVMILAACVMLAAVGLLSSFCQAAVCGS